MHEHQIKHEDGTVETTGFTVVHRESEWDETTRERVQRLTDYEQSLCPCGCGVPIDQAWDPFFEPWSVDSFTCYARRALERVRRNWEKKHEGQGEGWADGIDHFVVPAEEAEHNEELADKAQARRRAQGGD